MSLLPTQHAGRLCSRLRLCVTTACPRRVPPGSASSGAKNVTTPCRCNLVGGQWYKYSEDSGATWSERRRIPIRVTSIDKGNPWNGTELQGWTVSKPTVHNGNVVLPYSKVVSMRRARAYLTPVKMLKKADSAYCARTGRLPART